jgi:hypothetical protein
VIINLSRSNFVRIAAFAWLASSLAACMPEYNWRDVRFEAQRLVVTLPGKPAELSRPIDLNGIRATMTMHGVKVNDLSYTLAWVNTPDATESTRDKMLDAMRAGMVRNVGAAVADIKAVNIQIPVTDASGKAGMQMPAMRLSAAGKASATKAPALRMEALFVARADRVYQFVVIGNETAFAQSKGAADSATQFLESVRFSQ